MNPRLLEQSTDINCCAKLGKTASETLLKLTEDYFADAAKSQVHLSEEKKSTHAASPSEDNPLFFPRSQGHCSL